MARQSKLCTGTDLPFYFIRTRVLSFLGPENNIVRERTKNEINMKFPQVDYLPEIQKRNLSGHLRM